MEFKDSETRVNLMRAFAGESQARNRYTFAASTAKKNGMYVIETLFTYTADQEKEHAKIFYNHLKELNGETIFIDGGYPVDCYDDVEKLLCTAQHNEYEENNPIYPSFAEIAKKEGFSKVAASFQMIAEIEKVHGDRFGKYADMLKKNQLFVSDVSTGWICLNCGYVYEGEITPSMCPVCQHDQGYFIRIECSPF